MSERRVDPSAFQLSDLGQMVGGAFAAAAVVAFTAQPLFRFADPSMVMAGGLAMAFGVLLLVCHVYLPTRVEQLTVQLSAWAALAIGFLFLYAAQNIARDASAANDSRCIAIQRDMLSAYPRRADSPDLFQALGCRPQGQGSVYAPPPARRISPGGAP